MKSKDILKIDIPKNIIKYTNNNNNINDDYHSKC